jgi:hypothetical protein
MRRPEEGPIDIGGRSFNLVFRVLSWGRKRPFLSRVCQYCFANHLSITRPGREP